MTGPCKVTGRSIGNVSVSWYNFWSQRRRSRLTAMHESISLVLPVLIAVSVHAEKKTYSTTPGTALKTSEIPCGSQLRFNPRIFDMTFRCEINSQTSYTDEGRPIVKVESKRKIHIDCVERYWRAKNCRHENFTIYFSKAKAAVERNCHCLRSRNMQFNF